MLFLFKVVYVFQFSVFYNICKENNYFEENKVFVFYNICKENNYFEENKVFVCL